MRAARANVLRYLAVTGIVLAVTVGARWGGGAAPDSIPMISSAQAATAPTAAEAEAGIKATFAKVNELLSRAAPATELAPVMYEDDLAITGEGETVFYPNLKSFMEPLQGYTRNPTCRLRVVDKVRASGNLAVAWTAEHCDAHGDEKAEDYRILYVFRHGAHGWRVTMESFSAGKM